MYINGAWWNGRTRQSQKLVGASPCGLFELPVGSTLLQNLKPAEAKRASECADGVVTVRNHPASVYPSFADIRMTLGIANVRGSIVACHDGDIYLIEADRPGPDMEKRYWEIYIEKRKELIDRTRAWNAAFGQLEAENEVRKWLKITKL